MKKQLFIPLFYSIIIIFIITGCGDDVEPMSGINPQISVSPDEESQSVIVGDVITYQVDLTGQGATFSSLTVSQSVDGKMMNYDLIDNETEDLVGTPYSADFTFTPTREMEGKIVTLSFKYENKTQTNSGATVINSGFKKIEVTVSGG